MTRLTVLLQDRENVFVERDGGGAFSASGGAHRRGHSNCRGQETYESQTLPGHSNKLLTRIWGCYYSFATNTSLAISTAPVPVLRERYPVSAPGTCCKPQGYRVRASSGSSARPYRHGKSMKTF